MERGFPKDKLAAENVVRISDFKMTSSSSSSRTWCSFCSRRYRVCSVLFVISVFIMLFIMKTGIFSRSEYYYGDKVCKLDEIPTTEDFDVTRFEGTWFGTQTKGMEHSVLAYFMQFFDIRADFKLRKDGNFDLKTIGSKFYGMWCPVGIAHADIAEQESPEKLTIKFDTPTGKKFGAKPAWILSTDYDNYAVLYSCWASTPDGTCDVGSAYAAVLQRKKRPLTSEERAAVDVVLSDSCINPKSLKPIKHNGYCVKDTEPIPDY